MDRRRLPDRLVTLGLIVLALAPAAVAFGRLAAPPHIQPAARPAAPDTPARGLGAFAVFYLFWWSGLLLVVWSFDRIGHHWQRLEGTPRPCREAAPKRAGSARPHGASPCSRRRRWATHERDAAAAREAPRRRATAPPAARQRGASRPPTCGRQGGADVPLIARTSIEQVQAAADMVEVVGQYTELKKAGANYSGRCPFHEERTPSFSVNPAEKLYYCFGCGAGGNLFGFVQAKENLDFADAVEYLADKYGIALEYDESSARGDADAGAASACAPCSSRPRAYYERVLATPRRPRRPASTSRGAASPTTSAAPSASASACRAGTSCARPPSAQGSATRTCSTPASWSRASSGRPYDRFRGRIMFPLGDERGRTLGFGARTMGDEKPKYLNSPETPLYHKSEALFGLDKAKAAARQEDRVTSSRATPTSWRSRRPACTTSWPAWARPSPSSSSSASRGSRGTSTSATTPTPPASAP